MGSITTYFRPTDSRSGPHAADHQSEDLPWTHDPSKPQVTQLITFYVRKWMDRKGKDMDEKSPGENSHIAWTEISDFTTNYIVEQT